MALPSNVSFGTVVGRFMRAVADGPDTGRDPDGIPFAGLTVKFIPSSDRFKNASATPPVMIVADPITATTDADGYLIDQEGAQGIRLLATDDEDLSPTGWTWGVAISGTGFRTLSFNFALPSDGTIDLATVVPVPGNPGQAMQDWLAAVEASQSAAVAAEESAVVAVGAAVDAVAAKDAAEAVPAQVDTAMAEQVGTGGEFDTKLNLTIGEQVEGALVSLPLGFGVDVGGTLMASRLANESGDIVLTVLGDSTGNDGNEWVRLLSGALAAAHPDLRVLYTVFDTTAQDYPAFTTIQAGSGGTSGGVVSDTFDRTGELVGTGPGWTGTAGVWSTSAGVAAPSTTGSVRLSSTSGDQTARFLNVALNTTPATPAKGMRFYAKYLDGTNHLFLALGVSTTGVVSATLFKVIGGVSTSLGTVSGLNPTMTPSAWNTFDVVINVQGEDVTATVNGLTVTATLTGPDVNALAPATQIAMGPNVATTVGSLTVGGVEFETPLVQTGQTLTVYNGSVAGSVLQYQLDRLSTFLAVEPDALVISSGHNYGVQAASEYLAAVDATVTAIETMHPDTPIVVGSQNPEYAPRGQDMIDAHLSRLTELRVQARRRGWGYVPVVEAFRAQPDGGASLVSTDGIHPLSAGSALWRDVFLAYLNANSV